MHVVAWKLQFSTVMVEIKPLQKMFSAFFSSTVFALLYFCTFLALTFVCLSARRGRGRGRPSWFVNLCHMASQMSSDSDSSGDSSCKRNRGGSDFCVCRRLQLPNSHHCTCYWNQFYFRIRTRRTWKNAPALFPDCLCQFSFPFILQLTQTEDAQG